MSLEPFEWAFPVPPRSRTHARYGRHVRARRTEVKRAVELTQSALAMDSFRDEHLQQVDWVTWSVFVLDPEEAAPEDVADLTGAQVAAIASEWGGVFEHCVDYDSIEDTRYYEWSIRIPQAEHSRRGSDGLPVVMSNISKMLRDVLPAALTGWEVHHDRDDTRREAIAQLFRSTYPDLITALDDAFLARRSEGAEELDPLAKLWHEDKTTMVGDYTIWLSRDPNDVHQPRLWLVLTAGVWPETDADNQQMYPLTRYNIGHATSGSLDHFDLEYGRPVLLLPRPKNPIFTVQVKSGSFPGKGILFEREAKAEGFKCQWTGRDPKVLVARVLREIDRIFPGTLRPSTP